MPPGAALDGAAGALDLGICGAAGFGVCGVGNGADCFGVCGTVGLEVCDCCCDETDGVGTGFGDSDSVLGFGDSVLLSPELKFIWGGVNLGGACWEAGGVTIGSFAVGVCSGLGLNWPVVPPSGPVGPSLGGWIGAGRGFGVEPEVGLDCDGLTSCCNCADFPASAILSGS